MNLDIITVQDCLDMYYFKGQITIINDGKVLGPEYENILAADRKSEQG